jgi:hypothetical protein
MRWEPKAIVHSQGLNKKFVFLSASFPAGTRDERYFSTSNPLNITDAVVATARAVAWASGRLVSGGHPTISPLLLSVGEDLSRILPTREVFVRIYQSRFFEAKIVAQTLDLVSKRVGEIVWTDAAEDQTESLALMRKKMLVETTPIAAIFIGGMEGVEEEFRLFRGYYPDRPVYCIGSPGGATKYLAEGIALGKTDIGWKYVRVDPEELLSSTIYPALMDAIVSDMEAFLERSS